MKSYFCLKIAVSPDSRNKAWLSFDGRNRQELGPENWSVFIGISKRYVLFNSIKIIFSLYVTTSIYPVPSICAQDQVCF